MKPFFEVPDTLGGGHITLTSINCVPYLVDHWNVDGLRHSGPACPATLAKAVPAPKEKPGDGVVEQVPDLPLVAKEQNEDRLARRNVMKEAKSLDHLMDHSKFNPYCRACVEARAQRKGKRKGGLVEQEKIPPEWGLSVTGDHLLQTRKENFEGSFYVGDEEIPCSTTAVVLFDRGTGDLGCFPKATRTTEDTIAAFQAFAGTHAVKSFYCDNAGELTAAALQLGWMNPTSTPGVPQTNGLAERMVRTVKEGARANLIQAGLSVAWFELAAPCFCFTRSTEGGLESPYFLKHGIVSNHERIPFGTLVDFMPVPNPNKEPGSFEAKTKPGLFVGYHRQPGGRWSGDYLVAELEPFRYNPDALLHEVSIHRTKEVVQPGRLGPITFPLADYRAEQRKILDEPPVFDPEPPAVIPEPIAPEPGDGIVEPEPSDGAPQDTRGQGGVTEHGRPVRKY